MTSPSVRVRTGTIAVCVDRTESLRMIPARKGYRHTLTVRMREYPYHVCDRGQAHQTKEKYSMPGLKSKPRRLFRYRGDDLGFFAFLFGDTHVQASQAKDRIRHNTARPANLRRCARASGNAARRVWLRRRSLGSNSGDRLLFLERRSLARRLDIEGGNRVGQIHHESLRRLRVVLRGIQIDDAATALGTLFAFYTDAVSTYLTSHHTPTCFQRGNDDYVGRVNTE